MTKSGSSHHSGFSLLELMAVIFIIGLALGVAGLSLTRGNEQDQLWEMLDKFMTYSEFASDQAMLSGKSIGLKLEPPIWRYEMDKDANLDDLGWRYSWMIHATVEQNTAQGAQQASGWVPLTQVEPAELPPSIVLEVEVDGLEWEYEEQLDKNIPVAAFYPSGDITDIQITISDRRFPGIEEVILLDETGKLVVESIKETRDAIAKEKKKKK